MTKYDNLFFFIAVKNDKELKAVLLNNEFTISKISENFEKVHIIDLYSFKIFEKQQVINEKIIKDLNLGNNIKFVSIKKLTYLISFLKNKKIVGINYNIGRSYSDLYINFLLRFFDIKFIQIANVGNRQNLITKKISKVRKFFYYYLNEYLARKITTLLSIMGIFHKVQIRFVTNSEIIKYKNINFISQLRNKFRISYVKEHILINSRSYDILKENIFEKKNKYISVLDEQLNDPQWLRFREKFDQQQIDDHYRNLNIYLNKLSVGLKKEILICLHPNDDLNEKKNIFKNFKVEKYKTRENIFKSYLVLFFESSAIIDAVLLNKNIATIKSKILDEYQKACGEFYIQELKIPYIDIDNIPNYNLNLENLTSKKFLKDENELKDNYKKYLEKYICRLNENTEGYKKIVNTLNERYFK